ncbi:MAG: LysR family transcriptional regulator, partial [Comamonadaceae bacterium]
AYAELFEDPLVAAIPLQHPLAAQSELRAADFDTLPYIGYPKDASSGFSRQVLALLLAAGARPQMRQDAKEIHTALGLVAAGLGATVVGRSVAGNNRTDVRFLPIADLREPSRVMMVRKTKTPNALVDAFVQILRAQVPAAGAPAG